MKISLIIENEQSTKDAINFLMSKKVEFVKHKNADLVIFDRPLEKYFKGKKYAFLLNEEEPSGLPENCTILTEPILDIFNLLIKNN